MLKRICSLFLVFAIFTVSSTVVLGKSRGTWTDVKALVGKEVRVKPRKGKIVYGVLKTATDSDIVVLVAGKKTMTRDENRFAKDEVKKVWRALLFDGRRKAGHGALIGAGAGAAILGGIAAAQSTAETGEKAAFTTAGIVVGAGLGAGLGAIAGFFVKSPHKKRDLIYKR
ncbi:MAG: hypothetical protein HKN25_11685 [Pyrinomonadaceae bacterium]|nr:hypothetical protein [Pyrinomonadaceae bacterium]